MKKIGFFMTLWLSLIYQTSAIAHDPLIHQYLTFESYQLLKSQLGYDVPEMVDYLGSSNATIGSRAFQYPYITVGAWREDSEDIVYGYRHVVNWPFLRDSEMKV